ncbi:MAG: hypothetical protein HGA22_10145, partial [Clostridiales bacterium]|nr:hypothetical protein [Clostridiales bacterium]
MGSDLKMILCLIIAVGIWVTVINIAGRKNKKQLHYVMIMVLMFSSLWVTGIILETFKNTSDTFRAPFVALSYFGLSS